MSTDLHQLINQLSQQLMLACKNQALANQEAWWMLEALTGKSKAALLASFILELDQGQGEMLKDWVALRVHEHKPLQYILGSVPFVDLDILVEPPILIPRPETEELVLWLLERIDKSAQLSILDLCTGSGCIALALAHALPHSHVTGLDINPQAVDLAQKNKHYNKISNVDFLVSDVYQEIKPEQQFDVIVGNPPYLAECEFEALAASVKDWEDKKALVTGNNGLEIYQKIIQGALNFLTSRTIKHHDFPALVLEVGPAQEGVLEALFKDSNFKRYEKVVDLQKKVRWIIAYV